MAHSFERSPTAGDGAFLLFSPESMPAAWRNLDEATEPAGVAFDSISARISLVFRSA